VFGRMFNRDCATVKRPVRAGPATSITGAQRLRPLLAEDGEWRLA